MACFRWECGQELACEEPLLWWRMNLSRDIVFLSREQSLTADSLALWNSEHVLPDILCVQFSLLFWWVKAWMLRIVIIYSGLKLTNTLCRSHLFVCQCLAWKASAKGDTFFAEFFIKQGFHPKKCCMFVFIQIKVYDFPLSSLHFNIDIALMDCGFKISLSSSFQSCIFICLETSWVSFIIHKSPDMGEK